MPHAAVPIATTPAAANASCVPPVAVSQPHEQAAERGAAEEREEVERRRAAAQVLGRLELDRRERVRAPQRVRDPGQEEQHADDRQRVLRREQQLEEAEADRADQQQAQARAARRSR